MTHHILVVDDEHVVRKLMKRGLSLRGYQVECVSGAQEALNRLETERYDLIISDNEMEDVTGLELIQRLQAEDPHLKVMMVSGGGRPEGLPSTVPFLAKPFLWAELWPVLEQILGSDES